MRVKWTGTRASSLLSSMHRSRGIGEKLILAVLLVVYSIPIWWFHHFPSQDGPGHLYNAYLLSGWWKSSFPVNRGFFALNRAPVPNWLTTGLLALLMQVMTPATAEKVVLTLYVIFLPLAMRYAARSLRSSSRYIYLLGFLFIYNYFFHLGMLNFCVSLAWYLVFIGYWARNRHCLGFRQILILLCLTLLFYFSNGLSYFIGLLTVAVLSVASFFSEYHRGNLAGWWEKLVRPHIGLLLVVPLSLSYLALHGPYYDWSRSSPLTWGDISWMFSRLTVLTAANDNIDLRITHAVAAVLVLAFGLKCYSRMKVRKLIWTDSLLIAALLQFILYLLAPEAAAGVGLIKARIILFPLLTLVLWLTVQPFKRTFTVILTLAIVFASLALVGRDVNRYVWQAPMLDQFFAAADHIERNSTILPLSFHQAGYDPQGRDRKLKYDPFLHATELIAIEKGLVDLNDYEAATRNFPLVYEYALDPSRIIGHEREYGFPPQAYVTSYYRSTGRFVDYVLLWNVRAEDFSNADAQRTFKELAANYELVYSAPQIPLQLFARRLRQSSSLWPGEGSSRSARHRDR